MKAALLVGIGGFLGSVARHALGSQVQQWATTRFPWPTFAVNVLGCLAIGLLAGLGERYRVLGADARLFLFTGVLGGFTTFSAFSLDFAVLWQRGEMAAAFGYVLASVVGALLALFLGLWVVRLVA